MVRRGREVRAALGSSPSGDFPPGHLGRQGRQGGGGGGRGGSRGVQRRRRLRPGGSGDERDLLPALLLGRGAAADDVFADRFQVQADDCAPTLVADVVVRPADRGETVVHRRGRDRRVHRNGASDRRVPVLVHHRVEPAVKISYRQIITLATHKDTTVLEKRQSTDARENASNDRTRLAAPHRLTGHDMAWRTVGRERSVRVARAQRVGREASSLAAGFDAVVYVEHVRRRSYIMFTLLFVFVSRFGGTRGGIDSDKHEFDFIHNNLFDCSLYSVDKRIIVL